LNHFTSQSLNIAQFSQLAISIGGDSDTIACITSGIAEAFYQIVPEHIIEKVWIFYLKN